jgi:hypothetical protein
MDDTAPEGTTNVAPQVVAHDPGALFDFIVAAFDGTELARVAVEGGTLGHAAIRVGERWRWPSIDGLTGRRCSRSYASLRARRRRRGHADGPGDPGRRTQRPGVGGEEHPAAPDPLTVRRGGIRVCPPAAVDRPDPLGRFKCPGSERGLGHHGRMLEATFVRSRGSRDHVHVTRHDGTSTGWDFPSYGEGLPHDLCHLVVEDGLGLSEGFWGLVDQHVDVGLANNKPTLMRDGKPLVDQPGVGFSGLMQAEEAVALLASPAAGVDQVGKIGVVQLGSPSNQDAPIDEIAKQLGFSLPDSATSAAIAAIRDRLRELGLRWRSLDDGGSIKLTFLADG